MTGRRWTAETVLAVDAEIAIEALPAALFARTAAEFTHAELAWWFGTTQSAAARLGGGRVSSSYVTLRRYAVATGTRLATVDLVQDEGRGTGPRSFQPWLNRRPLGSCPWRERTKVSCSN